ncbi:uncharacterized protein [Macrobrachium rosenbergii]|uniref:uncharacterized protein n=1 Tax=Macrobrachium rosenbergii TaxID=79674 RepID=UPI0034D460CE
MVQSVLVGKAQIAFSTLSLERSNDYDAVREVVLAAYKLVPEAYRQNFRQLRKTQDQTYREFARNKERLFVEWCESRSVDTKEDLKQLILLEDFKENLPDEIKTHLEEKQVVSLDLASTMADEYVLTHKPVVRTVNRSNLFSGKANVQRKFSHSKNEPNVQKVHNTSPTRRDRSNLVCWGCGKAGHVIAMCRSRKMDNKKKVLLLQTLGPVHNIVPSEERGRDLFSPYKSSAKVSSLDNKVEISVQLLRDTGASQSLILKDVLPDSLLERCKGNVILGVS